MKLDFTKNLIYFPTPVLLKPKICMRAKLLTFLKLKNMKRLLRRRAQFIQYVNFAYIILERQNSFILPYRLTFYLKLIIKSIFLFLYKIHPPPPTTKNILGAYIGLLSLELYFKKTLCIGVFLYCRSPLDVEYWRRYRKLFSVYS